MEIICITNRLLVNGDVKNFYDKIEKIAKAKPNKIILREKDLSENEYKTLAKKCKSICDVYGVDFAINKFIVIAKKINVKNIHLSITDFKNNLSNLKDFNYVGVSVHSLQEAKEAEKYGANYIIAGHIFATDCKKDIPPRGTSFLKEICENIKIPVYAIGGINNNNICEITKTASNGICLMSSLMKSEDPEKLLNQYRSMIKKCI